MRCPQTLRLAVFLHGEVHVLEPEAAGLRIPARFRRGGVGGTSDRFRAVSTTTKGTSAPVRAAYVWEQGA